MEKNQKFSYLMLLEDLPQTHYPKVQFCKFIKVLEVLPIQFQITKREQTATQQKFSDLRENAKKLEQIDGGLRPSKNIYKAFIDPFGVLTDLRTGKTLSLSQQKFSLIIGELSSKKLNKTKSLLPQIRVAFEVRSSISNRASLKLPRLKRVKRRV